MKTAYIQLRTTEKQKLTIERKARSRGLTTSAFLLSLALTTPDVNQGKRKEGFE